METALAKDISDLTDKCNVCFSVLIRSIAHFTSMGILYLKGLQFDQDNVELAAGK